MNRTALGIDIANGQISIALLKKVKSGVMLMKTASAAIPDGVVKDGNIENPAVLSKAIRKLQKKNNMRCNRAALSLIANPLLMQVLELPPKTGGDIGKFVNNEVKHYGAMPVKEVAVDFCGLKTVSEAGNSRVLVAAADSYKVTGIARSLHQAGFNIEVIEPAPLAYIRACFAKKIAKNFQKNLVLAVINYDAITLCMFKKQDLEFLRSKRFETGVISFDNCLEWIAKEVNELIQFYEIEMPGGCMDWEMCLVAGDADAPVGHMRELLETRLASVKLEVKTCQEAVEDSSVIVTKDCGKCSVAAVGLAMRLLKVPGCDLNVNLVPQNVVQTEYSKRQALVIVNVAAVIIFTMITIGYFLNFNAGKINENVTYKEQMRLIGDTESLLKERTSQNRDIKLLTENVNKIETMLNSGSCFIWGDMLRDISSLIPKSVQITSLARKDDFQISIEGRAISHRAVRVFVDMLGASEYIKSSKLINATRDADSKKFVEYSINCKLI